MRTEPQDARRPAPASRHLRHKRPPSLLHTPRRRRRFSGSLLRRLQSPRSPSETRLRGPQWGVRPLILGPWWFRRGLSPDGWRLAEAGLGVSRAWGRGRGRLGGQIGGGIGGRGGGPLVRVSGTAELRSPQQVPGISQPKFGTLWAACVTRRGEPRWPLPGALSPVPLLRSPRQPFPRAVSPLRWSRVAGRGAGQGRGERGGVERRRNRGTWTSSGWPSSRDEGLAVAATGFSERRNRDLRRFPGALRRLAGVTHGAGGRSPRRRRGPSERTKCHSTRPLNEPDSRRGPPSAHRRPRSATRPSCPPSLPCCLRQGIAGEAQRRFDAPWGNGSGNRRGDE